jgi:glycosyltransferase involved in cell wall biosynthesis
MRLTNDLPIYVEVCPLLTKHFTGIGRFVARMVEAMARRRPLRLVNTIQGKHAENMRLSDALLCGTEVDVVGKDLPDADYDVQAWARRLFKGPRRPHDNQRASAHAGLYSMIRPAEKHFGRELCVLYDFTTMLIPALHVAETREHFGKLFTERATLCDKLVAISASTKADAAWLCNRPNDDVVVCYPGPSLCVKAHAYRGRVPRRKDIVLVVSTLEPRKNLPFLFKWFMETETLGPDAELWCVGPQGWLLELALTKGAHRRIRYLGVVSDRRLCQLYQQAEFTIYPSLYEGFGFPVLDSLKHGTPVLCSYNSSLQEFAGPGVFYFDACDAGSLDDACRELRLARLGTVARNDLDDRFSWDVMASKVISLCA